MYNHTPTYIFKYIYTYIYLVLIFLFDIFLFSSSCPLLSHPFNLMV